MKLKLIALFSIATVIACQKPEDIAELSAPVAYALARNAIKNKKPTGKMNLMVDWQDLRMQGDWPIGKIRFIAELDGHEDKPVGIDYTLDGSYNATALVAYPGKEPQLIRVNLHNSAVITGQSESVEQHIDTLAANLAPALSSCRTAVFDMQGVQGERSTLGLRLSESIITALVKRKVPIVERKLLEPVFKELSFGNSGLTADEARQKIGQLLGAECIVTGTIKLDKESIIINARSVSVGDGIIKSTAQAIVPRYLFRSEDLQVLR